MLKFKLAVAATATVLMTAGALAQSNATGGAAAPAMSGSEGSAKTGGSAGSSGGQGSVGTATKEIPNMQKNGMGNGQAPGTPTTSTQQNGATNN